MHMQAALNMLKVLLAQLRGEERPKHLQRDSVLLEPMVKTMAMGARRASMLHGVCHAMTCHGSTHGDPKK